MTDYEARELALVHFCRRLNRMVQVAHRRGYEDLWVLPHVGGPGCYRLIVTPGSNVRRNWELRGGPAIYYSSAGEFDPFGWDRMSEATPEALADRLAAEEPDLLAAARRPNPRYVTWFGEIMAATEPDALYLLWDANRMPEPEGPIFWWPLSGEIADAPRPPGPNR